MPFLATSLAAVHEQRRVLEAQIEVLLGAHPLSKVLTSMPGVAVGTAAVLLVTVGDGGSFPSAARLVSTVAVPLDPGSADAPGLLHRAGHTLLVQRGDAELVVLDPDSGDPMCFPAPWPRGFGAVTVSPDAGTAVFARVHAVRCVNASGAVVWEVRHGCWAGECP